MPHTFNDPCTDRILHMLIVVVCSSNYIKNPYLTAKLVEVIFVMNPNIQQRTESLHEKFLMHPLALQHLVPALMLFYTGKKYTQPFFGLGIIKPFSGRGDNSVTRIILESFSGRGFSSALLEFYTTILWKGT